MPTFTKKRTRRQRDSEAEEDRKRQKARRAATAQLKKTKNQVERNIIDNPYTSSGEKRQQIDALTQDYNALVQRRRQATRLQRKKTLTN